MDRVSARLISCLLMLCIATDALAIGFPPFARGDSFTVFRGETATHLDNGNLSVLDNDFDWEGDDLTAILDKKPKHGTLELRPDGTFVYVHDGSKADKDEFRYEAFDGTRSSRSTTVTITIEDIPNQPPRVVRQVGDQEAVEGARFSLDLSDNFTDPDPDDALTFSARGLPGSDSLTIDPITGVLSGRPKKGDARSRPYDVEITARDRAGDSARLNFDLFIREDDRADVALDIRVPNNPTGVGETSRWDLVIDNLGPGELEIGTLTAEWSTAGPTLSLNAPAGCSMSANNTSAPVMTCDITGLSAGASVTYAVQGNQSAAGDNTLIGRVIADDPKPGNNTDLASAQVVAAFSEGPAQVIDFPGVDIDAGDLNGDGDIDIVAAGSDSRVFLNNGSRSLRAQGTSLGDSTAATSVTLLDWNGDSRLDIAIGVISTRAAEIHLNDGSGNFSRVSQAQGGIGVINDVAAADFDGDGRSELVVAGNTGIVIARNNGQDGANLSTLNGAGAFGLTTADIDRDGDMDIVAIRSSNRMVRVFYNDGSGSSFNRVDLQYGSVGTVSVTDVNGDRRPDLLLGLDGDDLKPPRHEVALQQADGQFSVGQSFGASPANGLLTGDVDGDGWTDIATINRSGVHQVYLGSSQGNLALAPEQLVSGGMRRGVLVDFNDDGSLDLILIGPDTAGLEIHANNGIGRLGRGDRVAPDLRLLGEATISLAAGATYVEAGATAVDDIDGDLSNQIKIAGTVNTTAVGTQTLTYTVSDRAGNTATAVRTIKVGVNEGTGGDGGGALSPALLMLLLLTSVLRHRTRKLAKIL